MGKITLGLGEMSYTIHITDSFHDFIEGYMSCIGSKKVLIVTDTNVDGLYSQEVIDKLEDKKLDVYKFVFKAGERSKHLVTVENIYKKCVESELDRSSCIIALGGGVVGDIAGFAASTYMRGINFVQIPTTLLAQVDSSVGGKTGVDYLGYKNIVGAFYQPKLVYINTSTLKTLPEREFTSGMAEVIKYGLIADNMFFGFLEHNKDLIRELDKKSLNHIIRRSCEIKAKIVQEDEKESGIRAVLNFGHTIGHAVESASDFNLLHGEAVAIGMIGAAKVTFNRGLICEIDYRRITELIESYLLPTKALGLNGEKIFKNLFKDKKKLGSNIRFILLSNIGGTEVEDILPDTDLRSIIDELCS